MQNTTVPLKKNQQIDFSNCMEIMVRDILKILMYEEDSNKVTQKIILHASVIRATIVLNEPDRHFERIAARRDFKWYHTGYTK